MVLAHIARWMFSFKHRCEIYSEHGEAALRASSAMAGCVCLFVWGRTGRVRRLVSDCALLWPGVGFHAGVESSSIEPTFITEAVSYMIGIGSSERWPR